MNAWHPLLRLPPLLDGRRSPTPAEALLLAALTPLGRLYGHLQRLRAGLYARGLRPRYRAPVPVISVGNLASGGTGKTPLVLWLAERLRETGRHPAIISRGYGQAARGAVTVVADARGLRLHPPQAADEPYLMARRLPGVPVLTAPQRGAGIRQALATPPCGVILLDDAFQHLPVARDLDLVLLDAARPWGNGQCLPAGSLREPPSALARAHWVILTRCDAAGDPTATRRLLERHAPGRPLLECRHRPRDWLPLDGAPPRPLEQPPPGPLLPFCAIARPDSFAATLAGLGVDTLPLTAFPDHHPLPPATLATLVARARAQGAQGLICTEKDLVKLDARRNWGLPIHALTLELTFAAPPTALLARIDDLFSTGDQRPAA
ncbi:MAG: tetraacyldisaccharide 4'-kinase [Magnetococcales bacterium]|nr:tetraacyldisaccharide 4'-kinase [Magnetococcales bacterium]